MYKNRELAENKNRRYIKGYLIIDYKITHYYFNGLNIGINDKLN